jgi:hypothetical protein
MARLSGDRLSFVAFHPQIAAQKANPSFTPAGIAHFHEPQSDDFLSPKHPFQERVG